MYTNVCLKKAMSIFLVIYISIFLSRRRRRHKNSAEFPLCTKLYNVKYS